MTTDTISTGRQPLLGSLAMKEAAKRINRGVSALAVVTAIRDAYEAQRAQDAERIAQLEAKLSANAEEMMELREAVRVFREGNERREAENAALRAQVEKQVSKAETAMECAKILGDQLEAARGLLAENCIYEDWAEEATGGER